ncbi:hypothetical protein AB1Y20_002624 [Prymnesium parvum]|uniref:Phospholipase D-like domain-containing protein n=1 Tax=Prymnesium parvum TaxID=97485 RepID=A0AB34J9U7_PRYPA
MAVAALWLALGAPLLRTAFPPRRGVRAPAMRCDAASAIVLLDSYEQTVRALLDEIESCSRGDAVYFQLYLLEQGASSERVLAALEEAGSVRGVRVSFALDVSYVSMLSRLTEKTTTLLPRVERMSPEWCTCTYGSKPDHSKYALFVRPRGASSAVLGGMNLGDRFADWRDFSVRIGAPHADALAPLVAPPPTPSPTAAHATRLALLTPLAAALTALALGTAATAAPLALCHLALTSDTSFAAATLATLASSSAAAAALGGAAFSLPRELRAATAALACDRSWLGDVFAPLRPPPPPPPPLPRAAVSFVSNRRAYGRYEVQPAFASLFGEAALVHYRVAMAYLGPRWGVEMVELALRRGARVDLLLPAQANVYAHANLKAAQKLLDGGWPTLRVYLSPQMIHAKATLARTASGDGVAFLGSANLVRGSLNPPVWCELLPYDELNALLRDAALCDALDASMQRWFDEARLLPAGERLLERCEWYREPSAWLDELWQ